MPVVRAAEGLDGRMITVSGLVTVPDRPPPAGGRAVLAWLAENAARPGGMAVPVFLAYRSAEPVIPAGVTAGCAMGLSAAGTAVRYDVLPGMDRHAVAMKSAAFWIMDWLSWKPLHDNRPALRHGTDRTFAEPAQDDVNKGKQHGVEGQDSVRRIAAAPLARPD